MMEEWIVIDSDDEQSWSDIISEDFCDAGLHRNKTRPSAGDRDLSTRSRASANAQHLESLYAKFQRNLDGCASAAIDVSTTHCELIQSVGAMMSQISALLQRLQEHTSALAVPTTALEGAYYRKRIEDDTRALRSLQKRLEDSQAAIGTHTTAVQRANSHWSHFSKESADVGREMIDNVKEWNRRPIADNRSAAKHGLNQYVLCAPASPSPCEQVPRPAQEYFDRIATFKLLLEEIEDEKCYHLELREQRRLQHRKRERVEPADAQFEARHMQDIAAMELQCDEIVKEADEYRILCEQQDIDLASLEHYGSGHVGVTQPCLQCCGFR